jgi:hypothetical protein
MADKGSGMVYTPMMYGGGMSPEVRENRRKRSLLGTEGSGKSPHPFPFFGCSISA